MKYFKLGPYELAALAIIALALIVRGVLIGLGWPLLDSDEGTMGLMAMHIAFRGEHPFFFYGQGYMGSTEAFLAAAMFHLFGVSSFTLRLGLLLIMAVFLIAMYLLTSLVYSRGLALVTVIFLGLGSNQQLIRELVAVGGDPETLVSGAILFLLAVWLALTSAQGGLERRRVRRLLAYGFWGLAAGFGLWSHLLAAPFILLSGLLLLCFCWRELLGLALPCLLLGLLIGGSPLIYYNLTAPPGRTTLFYLVNAITAGGATWHPTFLQQVKGAVLVSLPTATGANPLCPVSDVHFLSLGSLHGIHCTLVHSGWAIGIIVLWGIATLAALAALWRYRASLRAATASERRELVLHSARLALLVNGAIPLVLYIFSPNSALYPVATSRYLIGLLVSTPAILWPLWEAAVALKPLALNFSARAAAILRRGGRAILLLIGAVLLLGIFSTFSGIPAVPLDTSQDVYYTQVNEQQHLDLPIVQALNRQEDTLIHYLLRAGVTRIYSDYWTCDRLIFQSQERIICSAVKDHLEPGHNRYPQYQSIVAADPHAAYVFHAGSVPDVTFAQRMASSKTEGQKYQHLVVAGYAIYQQKE